MVNQKHLDTLKKGVGEWNRWRATEYMSPDLSGACLYKADLSGADLSGADLSGADLSRANLRGADLSGADLSGADLSRANLSGTDLSEADLSHADFRSFCYRGLGIKNTNERIGNLSITVGVTLNPNTFIVKKTQLVDKYGIGPSIVDASWTGTILSVIDWSEMTHLGDEKNAQKKVNKDGRKKELEERLEDYKNAVRAAIQLALVLQQQGISYASDLMYRSKCLERMVLWYRLRTVRWHHLDSEQKTFQSVRKGVWAFLRLLCSWLFSCFLSLLAGYGYKPERSFLAYLFVIFVFTASYYLLGLPDAASLHHALGPHYLTWNEAIVVSMTAFHGRGFFTGTFQPGDPQAFVAACEAFVGLIIEVTFIATLTRRFFGQ